MEQSPNFRGDDERSPIYEIRVKGHLDQRWTDWFEGMTITLADPGETILSGPVVDQAALHSLFRKVRDLGLPLLSVKHIEKGSPLDSRKSNSR